MRRNSAVVSIPIDEYSFAGVEVTSGGLHRRSTTLDEREASDHALDICIVPAQHMGLLYPAVLLGHTNNIVDWFRLWRVLVDILIQKLRAMVAAKLLQKKALYSS